MDYETILESLRSTLVEKEKSYSQQVDRTVALGVEYEKAQATETKLAQDIEKTKASIRGIEYMLQEKNGGS